METDIRRLRGVVLVLLVVAACSESSRRPPTAPQTVFTRRLELVGPTTVPLGKTVQYNAIAHLSDGTTKDVTAEATWFTNRSDILTAAAGGAVTGAKNGEASLSANSSGARAMISTIIVVPEGTYRLTGTVRDAGVQVDAVIRIDSAPLGRLEVATQNGNFVVYGVAGDTRLIVMKDGYQEEARTLVVSDHSQVDFDLVPSRPRPDLTGNYRLSITAAPGCSSLPEDGRERSFDAAVQQDGPRLTVVLSGGEFATDRGSVRNRFTGFVEPDRTVFRIVGPTDYYYYYYGPDISEVLAPGRFYSFDGVATVSAASSGLRGKLTGWVRVRSGVLNASVGGCQSNDHAFVLAR